MQTSSAAGRRNGQVGHDGIDMEEHPHQDDDGREHLHQPQPCILFAQRTTVAYEKLQFTGTEGHFAGGYIKMNRHYQQKDGG